MRACVFCSGSVKIDIRRARGVCGSVTVCVWGHPDPEKFVHKYTHARISALAQAHISVATLYTRTYRVQPLFIEIRQLASRQVGALAPTCASLVANAEAAAAAVL